MISADTNSNDLGLQYGLCAILRLQLSLEQREFELSGSTYTWFFFFSNKCGSLVAQMVNNLPAMQETQVQSLGQ